MSRRDLMRRSIRYQQGDSQQLVRASQRWARRGADDRRDGTAPLLSTLAIPAAWYLVRLRRTGSRFDSRALRPAQSVCYRP